MDVIHISQFYSCSEIGSSSELCYVCELGKYLYYNFGRVLSLDGVLLDVKLKKSHYWQFFRLAVDLGWVIDTGLPAYEIEVTPQSPMNYTTDKLRNFYFTTEPCYYDAVDCTKRIENARYNFETPKPVQVCFTERSENWYWTIKGTGNNDEIINTASLNTACASQAWLSMIAMVAVERLMTGFPKKLGIEFPYISARNQLALSDFLILMDNSSALLGWVIFSFEYTVSDAMKRQVGYETWWYQGEQQGYVDRWYSPKEKYLHMKNDLGMDVGDVVILYERDYCTASNYIKSIASCHFAIIREISKRSVTFEEINTVRTRWGSELAFRNKTMAVKEMYKGSKSYKEWNSSRKTYDFNDLGIEYYMQSELYFIVPLTSADDIVELDVQDNNGRTGCYALSQNDVIYWLLKDYNIEFNEDKFLETYFGGRDTAYNVFMSGRELPEEWKVDKKKR